jgi:hypothetical protein
VEVWNNKVLFSPFEAGKTMDQAMTDIRERWDEVERGELQSMCKNAVLYGRVKQTEPDSDYMATLLRGTIINYYTVPDMMAVESPEYESNDRYAIGVQFRSFRTATNVYRSEHEGERDIPLLDRYENAMLRVEGAAENILEFMNADIWGEAIRAPGDGHTDSPYNYELKGDEKRDTFEAYKDPGEPDYSGVVPLEDDDDHEVGDDFFPSGQDDEEYDEDVDHEYDIPEVSDWEQGAPQEEPGGGYEIGEKTPLMRLIPEVSDHMFGLVEQLTKAWVVVAGALHKGASLGDDVRTALVESLDEAIRDTRAAGEKFSAALADEGKVDHVMRFEQLMEKGWRNEEGTEVKGLLKVAAQMRDMSKTRRMDTYIDQGRAGHAQDGGGGLPEF